MNRTNRIGLASELAFQRACIEIGVDVAVPVGPQRYDLLLRVSSAWWRVQVKTGRLRSGAIQFNTCSNAEGVGRKVGYDGVADAIGVYCPDLDRCFLVPLADCARSNGRLRVSPSRNRQSSRVRWADDYRLSLDHLASLASRAG